MRYYISDKNKQIMLKALDSKFTEEEKKQLDKIAKELEELLQRKEKCPKCSSFNINSATKGDVPVMFCKDCDWEGEI